MRIGYMAGFTIRHLADGMLFDCDSGGRRHESGHIANAFTLSVTL